MANSIALLVSPLSFASWTVFFIFKFTLSVSCIPCGIFWNSKWPLNSRTFNCSCRFSLDIEKQVGNRGGRNALKHYWKCSTEQLFSLFREIRKRKNSLEQSMWIHFQNILFYRERKERSRSSSEKTTRKDENYQPKKSLFYLHHAQTAFSRSFRLSKIIFLCCSLERRRQCVREMFLLRFLCFNAESVCFASNH